MMKKILCLIFVLIMALALVACKKGNNTTGDTGSSDVGGESDDVYDFPELDMGGKDFTFFNVQQRWEMASAITIEQLDGIAVNKAIYERNAAIEKQFNVKIKEIRSSDYMSTHTELLDKIITGDTSIDAAICNGGSDAGGGVNVLFTNGVAVNLNSIESLNLDKEWWDQSFLENTKIGDSQANYFALSDISMSSLDLTWAMMFNKDILAQYSDLTSPYELVKSGNWTMEQMWLYAKTAMNQGTEGTYFYQEGGNSTFGLVTYRNFLPAMWNGAGLSLINVNADGTHSFAADSERFLTFISDTAENMGTMGLYLDLNGASKNGETGKYTDVFKSGRALFIGAEIKDTSLFKDINYGVLPLPKNSTDQENYVSNVNHLTPVLVIPTTNAELDRTGIILDAMAYVSHRDVLPVYFDKTLSSKNTTDTESVEMLNMIRGTRHFEIGQAYGWTLDLYKAIVESVSYNGDGNIADTVDSGKSAVEGNIQATYDLLNSMIK